MNFFKHTSYRENMNLAGKIILKKPSEELLNLIKEIGNLGKRLAGLFETIKQKGEEEGFTNDEIRDLLKTHLRGSLTRGQINWYLYEKDKMNLRKQLTISGQIEGNNLLEQASVERLKPRAERQGQLIEKKEQKNNNKTSPQDLKATIKDQLEYISKLEDTIQEKLEIQRAHSQVKVKAPLNLLYRDILMLRNSGTTDIYIMIDEGKYVGLKGI
jgi:hypothetical protein